MRKKLDDNGTYSKPYARISEVRRYSGDATRTNVRLWLSVGTCIKYGLKNKEKVDLFWERKNEVWKKSILIIKRDGTQRTMNAMGKGKNAFCIQMKMFVKQLDIPIFPFPLPILDYVICSGGDEIWIDFSGVRETEVAQHKLWQKRYGTEKRHTFNFGNTQLDVRSNAEFIDQCKVMAKGDGGSLAGLVLRLLATHMEDKHRRLWYQLVNSSMEG